MFPDVDPENAKNHNANIKSYRVRLSKIDDNSFELIPLPGETYDRWVKELKEPLQTGWSGEISSDKVVNINGVIGYGFAFTIMEFTGSHISDGVVKGKVIMKAGFGNSIEPVYDFKTEWALFPVDLKGDIDISNQVIYDGPPMPEPYWPEMITKEEEAKRPMQSDRGVRRFASHPVQARQRFYDRLKGSHKAFYDRLLSELTWEEIKYTPGILLLIDHLATLDKEDQERIAAAYVRDGSVDFFGGTPYEKLQQVPPLLLMLRCLNKMKPEDVQGLTEESPRFQTMREAYESIPSARLADTSLRQFVTTISERLPEAFRKEYYSQSPKLRDYVKESGSSALRDLYLS